MMLGASGPRLSRHLYMTDVAQLLRDDPTDDRPVTRKEAENARNKLRRLERDLGRQLVFGGGYRDGLTRRGPARQRGGGGKCWTTLDRLRHAGLVDDHLVLYEQLGERFDEVEQAVELTSMQFELLAKTVARMQRELRESQEKLNALLLRGGVPARTSAKRRPAL